MPDQAQISTTIMFADICRSTYLFSQLGDEQAAALIGKTLNHAGYLVQACQGSVLRSMGDDIMCIFDDPHDALRAALDIHEEISHFSSGAGGNLRMRIGINSGSVLFAEGDILGESVNTAARLSAIAKSGQTVVSGNTIDLLDRVPRGMIRPLGDISLKGLSGPIPVFEFLDTNEEDDITQVGAVPSQFPKSNRLSIRFQSRTEQLDYRLVRFLLGRHPDCDLVLDHPQVSRHHAEIRYQNNEFVLIDVSTNGTEVISGGRSRSIHHGQAALRGSGSIYLGRTVYNPKFEIAFEASGGASAFNQTNN
jgi:class 3 adenylate cyclase